MAFVSRGQVPTKPRIAQYNLFFYVMKILLPSRRQEICDVSRRPYVILDSLSIADPKIRKHVVNLTYKLLLNDIHFCFVVSEERVLF